MTDKSDLPRPVTLEVVPIEHRLAGSNEEDWDDGYAPGYCTCGRWAYIPGEGPDARTCEGLLAAMRGLPVPDLDRVVWRPIDELM